MGNLIGSRSRPTSLDNVLTTQVDQRANETQVRLIKRAEVIGSRITSLRGSQCTSEYETPDASLPYKRIYLQPNFRSRFNVTRWVSPKTDDCFKRDSIMYSSDERNL